MAVAQIAVVAKRIIVKSTQDGIIRAPLIAGSTNSRVSVGLFKTPTDCAMAGLLAARLSSHSVFPKACKKHLQFKAGRYDAASLLLTICYVMSRCIFERDDVEGTPCVTPVSVSSRSAYYLAWGDLSESSLAFVLVAAYQLTAR